MLNTAKIFGQYFSTFRNQSPDDQLFENLNICSILQKYLVNISQYFSTFRYQSPGDQLFENLIFFTNSSNLRKGFFLISLYIVNSIYYIPSFTCIPSSNFIVYFNVFPFCIFEKGWCLSLAFVFVFVIPHLWFFFFPCCTSTPG